MNSLTAYLPGIYKHSRLMRAIMAADGKELSDLSEVCDGVFKEMLIDTAVDKIPDYEKSLCITPDINATLEERRSNIKSKMRGYGVLTADRLKEIIEAYAKGDVEITENFSSYTITVKFVNRVGRPSNMEDVKNVVNNVIPAHIAIEYVFIYNDWENISGSTWQALTAITWDDVLNKEVTANE